MLNLFLALLLVGPGPRYSAVVVDAVSHKPLAGVSVRLTDASDSTRTNAHGRFQLPAGANAFDLSLDGYAPLHGQRPAGPGAVDTLRLRATTTMLPTVTLKYRGANRPVRVRSTAPQNQR